MLSLIVAMDKNNLIGYNNGIPWNIPEDLALFKKITSNGIVIMGRKTFESIGRPLPNRVNIILTKDSKFNHEGIFTFNTPEKALNFANEISKKENKKIFIIGGSLIYKFFLPLIDEIHLSIVKGDFSGDTYFPVINFTDFSILKREKYKEFEYLHLIKNTCIF
ncbi:dihydrofolate reductase [Cetobacterium sp.]|uniref:dihydrofolate reductase n=1 Tax=Cetobacterium sp. TaxID=2071632 RepID=UPI002FC6A94D